LKERRELTVWMISNGSNRRFDSEHRAFLIDRKGNVRQGVDLPPTLRYLLERPTPETKRPRWRARYDPKKRIIVYVHIDTSLECENPLSILGLPDDLDFPEGDEAAGGDAEVATLLVRQVWAEAPAGDGTTFFYHNETRRTTYDLALMWAVPPNAAEVDEADESVAMGVEPGAALSPHVDPTSDGLGASPSASILLGSPGSLKKKNSVRFASSLVSATSVAVSDADPGSPGAITGDIFLAVDTDDGADTYYVNLLTRETTWTLPGPRSKVFAQVAGATDDESYFYNKRTKSSHWTLDEVMPTDAPPADPTTTAPPRFDDEEAFDAVVDFEFAAGTEVIGAAASGPPASPSKHSLRFLQVDTDDGPYYVNLRTQETTWDVPPQAKVYQKVVNEGDDGGEYFWNASTNSTYWDIPGSP